MFNALLLDSFLDEEVMVWLAGVTYGISTAFFLPINVQIIGLKVLAMRLLWILTSILSYFFAVQLTMSTMGLHVESKDYLGGGLVGGAILLVGLSIIMIWSKTAIRPLMLLMIPIVGGAIAFIAMSYSESLGLLYIIWQSIVSMVIVSVVKSQDKTK